MKLRFVVQGSAVEPYVVVISRDGENLTATCDCGAGSKGQYCKHRFSLFQGSDNGVIGGNVECISDLPQMVAGTDVAAAMKNLAEAEDNLDRAKSRVLSAKKALASAMQN